MWHIIFVVHSCVMNSYSTLCIVTPWAYEECVGVTWPPMLRKLGAEDMPLAPEKKNA